MASKTDPYGKLTDQRNNHTVTRAKSESLLIGRIYDDRGNRMTPSHARKEGIKYRYYLSSPLLHGQPGRVGLVRRVPAAEVEALVACAVREHLGDPKESEDRDRNHVVRVEVQADQLAVELKALSTPFCKECEISGTSKAAISISSTVTPTVMQSVHQHLQKSWFGSDPTSSWPPRPVKLSQQRTRPRRSRS
jgi:hypothetical protein